MPRTKLAQVGLFLIIALGGLIGGLAIVSGQLTPDARVTNHVSKHRAALDQLDNRLERLLRATVHSQEFYLSDEAWPGALNLLQSARDHLRAAEADYKRLRRYLERHQRVPDDRGQTEDDDVVFFTPNERTPTETYRVRSADCRQIIRESVTIAVAGDYTISLDRSFWVAVIDGSTYLVNSNKQTDVTLEAKAYDVTVGGGWQGSCQATISPAATQ